MRLGRRPLLAGTLAAGFVQRVRGFLEHPATLFIE